MAVVKFDSKYLKSQVCPTVSEAVGKLDNAYYYASNITSYNVPSDFKYKDKVVGYDTKIRELRDKLARFNTWIDSCEKAFGEVVREHEYRIKQIDDVEIKKREVKL